MFKNELRELYKSKRKALAASEQMKLDDLLLIKFQEIAFENVKTLLSFWPIDAQKEVNTHIMADYLFLRIPDLQVCFPVIDADTGKFRAIAVDGDTDFKKNKYGIPEPVGGVEIDPEDIDLAFVPLLCFDEKGFRVGYGKGYYDKFLSQCRSDIIKTGFSYFDPIASVSDINEFDVPLSLCITPNMIYEF